MEALSKEQIPFIFKGGTSLLLIFNRPYRLSIDIDIIFEEDISKLPDLIDILVSKSIFIRWENDVRQSHNVPKSHYKIFYKSTIRNREEDYILLDILAESNPYPEIISKPITSPLILNRHKPTEVRLPDIDGILGDKLTAFAPNTTGIPYGKDKEQEIIKQLFDIELLFHEAKDLRKVNLSFNTIASREIQYRSQNIAPSDVLDDIFHTASVLAYRGISEPDKFEELKAGVQTIASHVILPYNMEHAIIGSSKAAYLSQLLLKNKHNIEYFTSSMDLRDTNIKNKKYNKLNKLKKSQPEAFYYWYQALSIE